MSDRDSTTAQRINEQLLKKRNARMTACCQNLLMLLEVLLLLLFASLKHVQLTIVTPPEEYSQQRFFDMSDRQRIVLETWRVKDAWMNPSMIIDPDDSSRIVMVWRMPDKAKKDKVGYIWLNATTFAGLRSKDMIENVRPDVWRTNLIAEDPRIYNHNGKLFITYNNHLGKYKKLYFGELHYNESMDMFYVLDPPNHVIYEGEVNIRHQKNWTPFDFCPLCAFKHGYVVKTRHNHYHEHTSTSQHNNDNNQQVQQENNKQIRDEPVPLSLFVYSLQPHRIVQPHPTNITGEWNAETVFCTEIHKDDEWSWGEMRGGSPPLLIDSEHYLSFFHSSGRLDHKAIVTYVMGAYMFQSKPPFAITHLSTEPIVHFSFINETINGWAYKYVDFIVFPQGFIFNDDYLYISYGRNDRDSWIAKVNKTALFDSMKPVRSHTIGESDWDKTTGEIRRHTYTKKN